MPQILEYYTTGVFAFLQERISLRARRKMWKVLIGNGHVEAHSSVLDVGTSGNILRSESNCFLRWLSERGCNFTLCSPEDLTAVKTQFPHAKILSQGTFASLKIPAQDQGFDWAFSSAVLEHVGSYANQVEHLSELGRVANHIFLTTPNRRHWLEFHTVLPLLHWLPKKIHRRVLSILRQPQWASEQTLNLVAGSELCEMAQKALKRDFSFKIHKIWTLGMPSNLILIAHRKHDTKL